MAGSFIENGTHQSILQSEPASASFLARAMCVSFVMVLALAGNTIIIAVIVRTEALRNITGLFLINLASADLCVILFSMPFIIDVAIWRYWRFSTGWCTVCGFLGELFTAASIATLAVISYDRYVAIVKPLHYQQLITPLRAGLFLVYIWIHSTVMACLPFFNIAEYSYVPDVGACTINWKTASFGFTIAMNLFRYFIPLLVILICYAEIFIVARKVKRQVNPINQTRYPSTGKRPIKDHVDMANFSVPANFGINNDDRQRTILFSGNVQIAESIHYPHTSSAERFSKTENVVPRKISEKVGEDLHSHNLQKVHSCEITAKIRFQPIIPTIESIQQTRSKSFTEHPSDPRVTTVRKVPHSSFDQNVNSILPGSCVQSASPAHQIPTTSAFTTNLTTLPDEQMPAITRFGSIGGLRRKSMRRTIRMQRLRDTKAVTTLLILVGALIVCWTPYVIVCFLIQSGRMVSSTLYGATFLTALCNSANNVLVYGIFNTKFRKGFKHLFQSCLLVFLGVQENDRPFPNNISQSVKIPAIEVTGQLLPRQRSF